MNQSQPQTLVIAVFLLYLDAIFLALSGGLFRPIGLLFIAGSVAAGYGIANERKWGYFLALVLAVLGLLDYAVVLARGGNVIGTDPIGLMFAIAQFALLVHPQSRDYQRIWFK